ncbi:MAG: hypothetical protein ABI651_20195, partial [Verrucomicrobiota bacterium]
EERHSSSIRPEQNYVTKQFRYVAKKGRVGRAVLCAPLERGEMFARQQPLDGAHGVTRPTLVNRSIVPTHFEVVPIPEDGRARRYFAVFRPSFSLNYQRPDGTLIFVTPKHLSQDL